MTTIADEMLSQNYAVHAYRSVWVWTYRT